MQGLPAISIKSKLLQADLGVKTTKSAKRKLMALGVMIRKGEYVLKNEVAEAILKDSEETKSTINGTYVKGSSFEDLTDD